MIGLLAKGLVDLKALADRLPTLWAAKLDVLHALLTSAWAAKLDALHTLLTSAWAAKLDADVSSRAAANDYTANRAAKLDNLDASILSRASANDYTANRAAKLDNLDGAISAISVIKSIQSGKVDTSTVSNGSNDEAKYVDVTITAVTTAKCIVLHQVFYGRSDSANGALAEARKARIYATTSDSHAAHARAYLTSTTNLRIHTGESNTYSAFSGRWWVVEFK